MPFQARVIDFLTNGLTDPRVANEEFPFDRPTLHSEHASTNLDILPGAVPGSGGIAPQMIAISPPNLGNHDFKVGVYEGLGGASAFLSYSLTAPGGPPAGGMVAAVAAVPLFSPVVLTGSGPGAGHGTWHGRIPLDPSLAGLEVWLQWFVLDPSAPRGAARTDIAHLTLF